jgi:hypothetical protein
MFRSVRHTCVLLASFALLAPIARADDFADFRIPAGRVLLWTGSTSGSANWGREKVPGQHMEVGTEMGALGSQFYLLTDSDPHSRELTANVSSHGQRSHLASLDSDPADPLRSRTQSDQDGTGLASASLSEQWFPGRWPLSVVATADASVAAFRQWQVTHDRTTYPDPYAEVVERSSAYDFWRTQTQAHSSAGVGIGHVRNATGLYEAAVLEQRLLASGVLTRPLGTAARSELVSLVYSRAKYARAFERPAAVVWGDLREILVRDGALADPRIDPAKLFSAVEPFLGAATVGASRDGLPVSPMLRLRGWNVRLVGWASTEHFVQRSRFSSSLTSTLYPGTGPFTSSSRQYDYSDDLLAGIGAEYHRPVGLRWQWDAALDARMPVSDKSGGVNEYARVTARWLVTNRWLLVASVDHSKFLVRDPMGNTLADQSGIRGTATCEYWVADHLDLNLSLNQGWAHDRVPTTSYGWATRQVQQGSLSVGLDYRFAGFADVPGVSGVAR